MAKTIAVVGSTGGQGGSVVTAMLKAGWNVRGLTRSTNGKGAEALKARGVEVVAANLDDEASLTKAFEGVQAVFAVTNWWEPMPRLGPLGASKYECEQAIRIATVASKVPTLEHFIWSTLPNTMDISKGKHFVPHMQPKSEVDDYIREKLPKLAEKTSFLWVSWYVQNLVGMPLIKFMPVPGSGKYLWLQPSRGDALLPTAGDISVNIGVFAAALIAHPEVSLPGKYAWVKTDNYTFEQIAEVWSKVTEKEAIYNSIPFKDFEKFWGPYGTEMATQYAFGEDHGDWNAVRKVLTQEELGIKDSDLVGLEATLKKYGTALL
ncbi:hypothetical protein MMC25_007825 [Agyrium rufum]|nr:hypothetical protein [Agyrium rufum]